MKLDELTDEEWELTFHHPLQQEDRGQMTALNGSPRQDAEANVTAWRRRWREEAMTAFNRPGRIAER